MPFCHRLGMLNLEPAWRAEESRAQEIPAEWTGWKRGPGRHCVIEIVWTHSNIFQHLRKWTVCQPWLVWKFGSLLGSQLLWTNAERVGSRGNARISALHFNISNQLIPTSGWSFGGFILSWFGGLSPFGLLTEWDRSDRSHICWLDLIGIGGTRWNHVCLIVSLQAAKLREEAGDSQPSGHEASPRRDWRGSRWSQSQAWMGNHCD